MSYKLHIADAPAIPRESGEPIDSSHDYMIGLVGDWAWNERRVRCTESFPVLRVTALETVRAARQAAQVALQASQASDRAVHQYAAYAFNRYSPINSLRHSI